MPAWLLCLAFVSLVFLSLVFMSLHGVSVSGFYKCMAVMPAWLL